MRRFWPIDGKAAVSAESIYLWGDDAVRVFHFARDFDRVLRLAWVGRYALSSGRAVSYEVLDEKGWKLISTYAYDALGRAPVHDANRCGSALRRGRDGACRVDAAQRERESELAARVGRTIERAARDSGATHRDPSPGDRCRRLGDGALDGEPRIASPLSVVTASTAVRPTCLVVDRSFYGPARRKREPLGLSVEIVPLGAAQHVSC